MWHQFFPLRALEGERSTVENAILAQYTMFDPVGGRLSYYLARVVVFQDQELQTAYQRVSGSAAQGCVSWLKSYMRDAIRDGQ